jgi:hypothetical protein
MQETQIHPAGIERLSAPDPESRGRMRSALAAILATREVRQFLGDTLPEVLEALAGDHRANRYVFKLLGRYLRRTLRGPDGSLGEATLQELLSDEQFVHSIATSLPGLNNSLLQSIQAAVSSIEELPAARKRELTAAVLSETADGQTGLLITSLCRIANDIHEEDPEFFTHFLAAGIDKWVEDTDFGELAVSVEGVCADLTSLARAFNDSMFERPAKIVLLLALLPPVANLLLAGLCDTVTRFNQFPPDVVADATISVFRSVDGKKVGRLLNEVAELARKLDVGSALTGQPGQPQFRMSARGFIDDLIGEMDGEVFWKAREAWEQGREAIQHATLSSLKKRPGMVVQQLRNGPALRSRKYRLLKSKLELLEELPEDDLCDAAVSGINRMDGDSLAEVLNLAASLFNRMRNERPDAIRQALDEFVNALDLEECGEAVKGLTDDLAASLRPYGRTIAPHVAGMAGAWGGHEHGGHSEQSENAPTAARGASDQKGVAA